MRLQRFLAQAGVASRRKSEDLIAAGLVAVNGRRVTTPGTTVDAERDVVTLDGRVVRPRRSDGAIVVALHKPPGVVTARGGPGTVYDLVVEPDSSRLVYVGRLDRDSEGLLLMTTDGELAHRLTHPSREIERVYEAWITGPLDERSLERGARAGIVLEDGERTAPFRARVLQRHGLGAEAHRRIELVLTEGKKREVRRIVTACGGRVERLVRTRYGPVTLGKLAPGAWRRLSSREVTRLRAVVGLGDDRLDAEPRDGR
jgi:23S rRNA pseudouridine2605 synthase